MKDDAYALSGKIGWGPVGVPLLGGVAALVLALCYAYVTVYSPIAGVVSLALLLGYAMGLGGVVYGAVRLSKLRNRPLALLLGAAVGAFGLYAAWAAFLAVLFSKGAPEGAQTPGTFDFLLRPSAMWSAIEFVNEKGWYSIKGQTPTHGALWLIWGIEAIGVIAGGAWGGKAALADAVFCETCGEWAEAEEPRARLACPADPGTTRALIQGGLDALATLPPAPAPRGVALELELLQCPRCPLATLQVQHVQRGVDDKGNEQVEERSLTAQRLITPEEVAHVRELASRELASRELASREPARLEEAGREPAGREPGDAPTEAPPSQPVAPADAGPPRT